MTSVREITVQRLEAIIGYDFEDESWAWEAVQMAGSGVSVIGGRTINDGNRRLAVCGDTYAQMIMVNVWYNSGTDRSKWTSQYSQSLLTNANFAHIGFDTGLAELLYKNPMNPCATSDGLAATLVEAILGAVHKDGGEAALRTVMRNIGLVPRDIALVKFNISLPFD